MMEYSDHTILICEWVKRFSLIACKKRVWNRTKVPELIIPRNYILNHPSLCQPRKRTRISGKSNIIPMNGRDLLRVKQGSIAVWFSQTSLHPYHLGKSINNPHKQCSICMTIWGWRYYELRDESYNIMSRSLEIRVANSKIPAKIFPTRSYLIIEGISGVWKNSRTPFDRRSPHP
jgi:hypothetical protein